MEQRNLGRSGLIVSAVGLGCNNFGGRIDYAATRAVVHKALDLGITFFDTSDTYGESGGSEEDGRAILGTHAEIAPQLRAFADAGVSHLVVDPWPDISVQAVEELGQVMQLLA